MFLFLLFVCFHPRHHLNIVLFQTRNLVQKIHEIAHALQHCCFLQGGAFKVDLFPQKLRMSDLCQQPFDARKETIQVFHANAVHLQQKQAGHQILNLLLLRCVKTLVLCSHCNLSHNSIYLLQLDMCTVYMCDITELVTNQASYCTQMIKIKLMSVCKFETTVLSLPA